MEPQVVWAPGRSSERLCAHLVRLRDGWRRYVEGGPVTTPEMGEQDQEEEEEDQDEEETKK